MVDREVGWRTALARIETAFERGDPESLCALLRDVRRSGLPPLPDAARRLLVIQGLERSERCASAGYLSLARVEFERAVARVEGTQSSRPPRQHSGSRRPAGVEVQ